MPTNEKIYKAHYQSTIGLIEVTGSEKGIASLYFIEQGVEENGIPLCLKEGIKQLDEYFKGKRKEFSLKLDIQGTDFQKVVWQELQKIPFGKTVSYLNIAAALGDKNSTRAVGNANGNNKISILIPCHRVIGNNGKLTGYAGGLDRKQWLINFENNGIQKSLFNDGF